MRILPLVFGPGGGGLDTFASRQQRANDYAKDMGYDLTDRSVNKQGCRAWFWWHY